MADYIDLNRTFIGLHNFVVESSHRGVYPQQSDPVKLPRRIARVAARSQSLHDRETRVHGLQCNRWLLRSSFLNIDSSAFRDIATARITLVALSWVI